MGIVPVEQAATLALRKKLFPTRNAGPPLRAAHLAAIELRSDASLHPLARKYCASDITELLSGPPCLAGNLGQEKKAGRYRDTVS
jgi:hypothetical protein